MTDTDRLAALIDECYQRGLDAPEAATFLVAAGVTLAPSDPAAPLDADAPDWDSSIIAALMESQERLAGEVLALREAADLAARASLLAELER